MKKLSRRLTLERLEDRDVPATFGVGWPDPKHLTVSFAPDGTLVDGSPSTLSQTMDAVAPTSTWQLELLRALQTWAVNTPINLGVVPDNGQPIGTPGAIQGDPRFGDIRLCAQPMASDVLALNSPYDLAAGTRAGDIRYNSTSAWGVGPNGGYDLFSASLDEVGNIFGLDDTKTDASSALYFHYAGYRTGIIASDVSRIQSLYGARMPDSFEGYYGNDSALWASQITQPDIEADVTTTGDVDYYTYTLPAQSDANVTVQVQTGGISLLAPKLTVLDSTGQVVGTATTTDPLAGGVSVQIANAVPGATYTFRVEAGRNDVFGIGGYRLKVHSGADSEAQIAALDAQYSGTARNIPQADSHTNDTPATATNLDPLYHSDPRFDYALTGTVEDATDLDYYSVTAQSGYQPQNLIVSTTAVQNSGLSPKVAVFDTLGNAVASDVIVNGQGASLVQVRGVSPGAQYTIQVSADAVTSGAYLLGVNFRTTALPVTQLVGTSLSNGSNAQIRNVTVTQSQLTTFTLSASESDRPSAVRMTIFDQNNNVVYVLTAKAGETVSGEVFLNQGNYRTTFVAATQDGSAFTPLSFSISGKSLTDPIEPVPIVPGETLPTGPTLIIGDPIIIDPSLLTLPTTNPWVAY